MRAEGKRIRTSHLEVRACASLRAFGRVGIIVAKHKHGSVERNRLKRRLRELVRTRLLPGLGPLDVVVRSFPTAYDAPFAALTADVDRIARKLGDEGRRITGGTAGGGDDPSGGASAAADRPPPPAAT